MAHSFNDERLRFFIGDVRDLDRLEMAMRGIDTVIHAAALKIVPTAEYNPTECIATNVTGAENVVKASLRAKVQRVVALSTDKAVNPINLYGASKLAAEKIFVAANALAAGGCHYNVVRYGNVAGSRGSVLPLFKKRKAEGKVLKVTDERMTRFWITMDQSVKLVLYAEELASVGIHSKILIPKIPSIRIRDLAVAVCDDYGFLEFNTGIRPGEKIHETLITEDESLNTTDFANFYCIDQPGHKKRDYENRVPPGWRYTSDTNVDWLTIEQLRGML
jgi:UDP-N-acetylglucosamine 4,6-dehydratase